MSAAQLERPTRAFRGRRPAVILAALLVIALAACQTASPSPSVSPSPSPTPEPPSGDEVIAAFLELAGDSQLTMHVVLDGTVDVTLGDEQQSLTLGMNMDISGPNAVGFTLLDTGPSEITFTMLLTGNRAYVEDAGTWTEVPGYQQTTPLNPFALLSTPADLSYDGQEELDGQRVHHLHALVWLGGDLAQLEEQGWADVFIDYNDSDIFVDDAGTPVRMEFRGGVSGQYQGADASAAFDVAYDFTNVGEPVDIPTPPETPAALFRDPVPGQAVYDEAEVLSAEVEATLEARIDAIEERSGAQVVIYFLGDPSATDASTLAAAEALMGEWGIGQPGVDDGFVILGSVDDVVRLATYSGAGLLTYLSEAEQQRLRDEVMLPAFAEGQFEVGAIEGIEFVDNLIP